MKQILFLILVFLPGLVQAESQTFSFWGNIQIRDLKEDIEFPDGLSRLTESMASECCPVRPGQALSLVRDGRVVGCGKISSIVAGNVPRAGDNRTIFFEVQGLPDSVVVTFQPRFPSFRQRSYDLYVIDEKINVVLKPQASAWPETLDFPKVVSALIKFEILLTGDLLEAFPVSAEGEISSPDIIAAKIQNEMEFSVIRFRITENLLIKALACKPPAGTFGPAFVRLEGAWFEEPEYIRGELDFALQVSGVWYLILRNHKPETGAWGYEVFVLEVEHAPRLVHSDWSWST